MGRMKHLIVAAALIVNEAGEVLCVLRGDSRYASTAHKWEFPGGKLEPGETAEQAAVREVREELGLEVQALALVGRSTFTYPEFSITLDGVLCVCVSGELELREHREARWVRPDRLEELDFAAADEPLLRALQERWQALHGSES